MGKIELDHTGSGSGITLSSDGTSLLLGGSAIGGGGADLYAANESSPAIQPSATGGNAIAIGDSTTAAGDDGVAIGLQAYARQQSALGLFGDAQSTESIAIGKGSAVSAAGAVQVGRNGYATATDAVSLGKSRASGTASFAAAIANSTTSYGAIGGNTIAMSQRAKASDGVSIAIGQDTIASNGGAAIGLEAVASGTGSLALGKATDSTGTGSLAVGQGAQATANYNLAIGLNANATAERAIAIGNNGVVAGSTYSTAIGHNSGFGGSTTATGSGATALGGSYASGADSFAAAIVNNTSSYGALGTRSVAIGDRAKSAGYGGIAIGQRATASGNYSMALGAGNGVVEATTAEAIAVGTGAYSNLTGKLAFSSGTFGSSLGHAQTGIFVLRRSTTNATPNVLATTASGGNNLNQVVLPNNSALSFHGTIVARQQASQGTASAAWKVEGLIRKEGTLASTVLVNSATTVLDNTPSWGIALSADTTNGALKIEVTGAASTNIRWVGTIHTSEVTYA